MSLSDLGRSRLGRIVTRNTEGLPDGGKIKNILVEKREENYAKLNFLVNKFSTYNPNPAKQYPQEYLEMARGARTRIGSNQRRFAPSYSKSFDNYDSTTTKTLQPIIQLESTLIREQLGIVRSLRESLMGDSSRYFPQEYIDMARSLRSLRGSNQATNNIEKKNKYLNILKTKYCLSEMLPEVILADLEFSEYEEIYDLLCSCTEAEAVQNYQQNYAKFWFLGSHNSELDSDPVDPFFYNGNNYILTPEERSVKSSSSTKTKIEQGKNLESIKDFYRATILVDRLFDSLDVENLAKIVSLEAKSKKLTREAAREVFNSKLKEAKLSILADYIGQKLAELESDGYTLDGRPKAKIYASGYTDITFFLKDSNGQKFEIQLQTQATLKVKDKETPENNKRKKIIKNFYSFFYEADESNKIPDIRKRLEAILAMETEKSEILSLEIEKLIRDSNLELSKEFEIQQVADFLLSQKPRFQESLVRSRIWYKSESTIDSVEDVDLLNSKLRNIEVKAKNPANSPSLKYVKPNFEAAPDEIKQTVRVAIVRKINGVPHALLVRKDPNSKAGDALEFPGGKVDEKTNDPKSDNYKAVKRETAEELDVSTEQGGERVVEIDPDFESKFSYSNPYNHKPTDVNLRVGRFTTAVGFELGKLEEDKHQSQNGAVWVPISELIKGSQTGYVEIPAQGGKTEKVILNGNTILPNSVLFDLYQYTQEMGDK